MAAREDLLEGLESRKTGERPQNKIEAILKGETPVGQGALERTEETYQSSSGRREIHDLVDEGYRPKSIMEMERALDELKKHRGQQEEVAPNPNPRKLG